MSQDVENSIEQHMKAEATKGHFENTFNEIKAELNLNISRGNVFEALIRMEGKKIISVRVKGKTKLYYLTELREMSQKAW